LDGLALNQKSSRVARDAVEKALAAIAARDARIGAFARLAPDARAQAAARDEEGGSGALHGFTVGLKDIIDTRGLGTEYSSDIYVGHVPTEDADCVRRLKDAGAIIIGKTVTTEFAHQRAGKTRNPHDDERTPGGSSSGSAAAVAAGMARVAIGTQTSGSVIRPASYCGVFGFKPSIGRVDRTGVHELSRTFDTIGWFATDVADLARVGRLLLNPPRAPRPAPSRPAIARLRTPFDARGVKEAHAVCDGACERLAAAGASVSDLALPPEFAVVEELYMRIVTVDAARSFASYRGRLSPMIETFIADVDEAGYEDALAEMAALRGTFARLAGGFDALAAPAATGEAPFGIGYTGDAIFSTLLALAGPACVALPYGRGARGLPIGVQFAGRLGEDEELFAFAEWASDRLGVSAMMAA